METPNELDKFLSHHMSGDELPIESPGISVISEARKKIMDRKKTVIEKDDYLSLFAAFLNLKVKLYHAVIGCIVIGSIIFFYTQNQRTPSTEQGSQYYVTNTVSVKSSTVLSCIKTFATKN